MARRSVWFNPVVITTIIIGGAVLLAWVGLSGGWLKTQVAQPQVELMTPISVGQVSNPPRGACYLARECSIRTKIDCEGYWVRDAGCRPNAYLETEFAVEPACFDAGNKCRQGLIADPFRGLQCNRFAPPPQRYEEPNDLGTAILSEKQVSPYGCGVYCGYVYQCLPADVL